MVRKKRAFKGPLGVSALSGYEHQVATTGAFESSEVYLITCRSADAHPSTKTVWDKTVAVVLSREASGQSPPGTAQAVMARSDVSASVVCDSDT